VCRTVRLRPLDGTVGVFDDHLLCVDCHGHSATTPG
jgi:hypothetical protein